MDRTQPGLDGAIPNPLAETETNEARRSNQADPKNAADSSSRVAASKQH